MEGRETPRMRKYGESKMTRIMMATVPHVTSGLGLRKFQADGFLLNRVYKKFYSLLFSLLFSNCFKLWERNESKLHPSSFRCAQIALRYSEVQPTYHAPLDLRTAVAKGKACCGYMLYQVRRLLQITIKTIRQTEHASSAKRITKYVLKSVFSKFIGK